MELTIRDKISKIKHDLQLLSSLLSKSTSEESHRVDRELDCSVNVICEERKSHTLIEGFLAAYKEKNDLIGFRKDILGAFRRKLLSVSDFIFKSI